MEALRGLGHGVVNAAEAGLANQAVSDTGILEHATGEGRAVLTLNRWDFVRLHSDHPEHAGIIVCTADPDHSLDEKREILIGHSREQRLLLVSFADRSSRIRIISARTTTRRERRDYEEARDRER